MQEDAQDMVSGDRLVALDTAEVSAVECTSLRWRTKQDLEHSQAEGKLFGRRREQLPGADAHQTTDEKGPGRMSSPNSPEFRECRNHRRQGS